MLLQAIQNTEQSTNQVAHSFIPPSLRSGDHQVGIMTHDLEQLRLLRDQVYNYAGQMADRLNQLKEKLQTSPLSDDEKRKINSMKEESKTFLTEIKGRAQSLRKSRSAIADFIRKLQNHMLELNKKIAAIQHRIKEVSNQINHTQNDLATNVTVRSVGQMIPVIGWFSDPALDLVMERPQDLANKLQSFTTEQRNQAQELHKTEESVNHFKTLKINFDNLMHRVQALTNAADITRMELETLASQPNNLNNPIKLIILIKKVRNLREAAA
ncbi:hypothetical protein ACQZV8_09555 [Magnetococcales bacterium HHB-1]